MKNNREKIKLKIYTRSSNIQSVAVLGREKRQHVREKQQQRNTSRTFHDLKDMGFLIKSAHLLPNTIVASREEKIGSIQKRGIRIGSTTLKPENKWINNY